MKTAVYIETGIYDSAKGVWINVDEISSFYGDGHCTVVLMRSGDKHTVRDSFEEFCKRMRKAWQ